LFVVGWQIGRGTGQSPGTPLPENTAQPASVTTLEQHENHGELNEQLALAQRRLQEQQLLIDELQAQISSHVEIPVSRAVEADQPSTTEDEIAASTSPATQPEAAAAEATGNLRPMPTPQELDRIKQAEGKLVEPEALEKPRAFLKRVSWSDISTIENSLQGIEKLTPQIRSLLGRYRGAINFFDPKRAPGRITIMLQEPSIKPYRAAVRVDVTDGKFDKTTHFGGFNQLKQLPGQSQAIFIESSDRSYLQLYFAGDQSVWIGNYYEKAEGGKYAPVGTFKLVQID
jgi:hypothetical protein